MRRLLMMLALCLTLGFAARGAHAEACTATATPVSFGNVSPIAGTTFTTTSTISVTCTWSAITLTPDVLVCLNLGGTSPRALTNGTNSMNYDLYRDAGHTQIWGSIYSNGTPISLTMAKPSGTSLSTTVTVYGQIASAQPTVPTVNNASTVYTQSFGGNTTSINYGFYTLIAPTCATLTATQGTFAFSSTATVINNCNISATNVAFGSAGVLSSALRANGSITAQCTNGDAFKIALNSGSSGNVAARTMARSGGGGSVSYQLYLDSGYSSAWGDGTGSTATAAGTGSGTQQVFTVYGRVPSQTTPAPGSYSDTITATIYF
ncbi:MAG: spore coat U domain-containing protein [Paraburkholderia tropica]|uniref:Spore coat protein U-like protein n=1 Tax=Paraburkholderia tropica TaxID=92647 RepID=A0ABX5MS30_9BURK|nr:MULTISPECIES: spore coat U domain-containing protein [Paraburkholderia]MDE1140143.1 spore coat U domain-containing protein [Paraburkholderia tropica]PXX18076.1 spore coat protein U-like protein [Paraburkholderia tropica]PZW86058.1 spore coat protein U-like protein [Paraburkholderia tropica]